MNAASILLTRLHQLDNNLRVHMKAGKTLWMKRDSIMRSCGFDSPKDQRVGAYVQFQSSVIRLNQQLKAEGLRIARSEDGAEIYSLVSIAEAL